VEADKKMHLARNLHRFFLCNARKPLGGFRRSTGQQHVQELKVMAQKMRTLGRYGVILGFVLAACAAEDRLLDCSKICDKYYDCVEGESDSARTDCTSSCQSHGANDSSFDEASDQCDHCLDEHSSSCIEAATLCLTCAVVIGPST
jgi:hypothetical protein